MQLETPNQLMARFERGEIERAELHRCMAIHARELISEMEEDHQNPAAAWFERVLAARMARRLVKRHGAKLVRECLVALSLVEDFPPAARLWNAAHPDVPLYCFMRVKRTPTFRLVAIQQESESRLRCQTEHEIEKGGISSLLRTIWSMERDPHWQLRVVPA